MAETPMPKCSISSSGLPLSPKQSCMPTNSIGTGREAAEAAFAEASKRVEEAEAYLEKAKNSLPHGGVWWMERELHEAKAYLPKSKGGISKN